MKNRFTIALSCCLLLTAIPAAALAGDDKDDHEPRMEVTLMLGWDNLQGDASKAFDDGPYGGFGFEFDVNRPHSKDAFRAFAVRFTGGYAGYDGAFIGYDTKLTGTVFGLDALVVANAGEIVKPYGFLGIGFSNLNDDLDIVNGGSGAGFTFGGGAKIYAGGHFLAFGELSHQDYQVDGDYSFSPSHIGFWQLRFGLGVRF